MPQCNNLSYSQVLLVHSPATRHLTITHCRAVHPRSQVSVPKQRQQAFLDFLKKDISRDGGPSVASQNVANVLYACAKLRQQPQPDELLLLLEAFVHPDVLAAANRQDTANVVWSLGVLSITPGWQAPKVSRELLERPSISEYRR